MTELWPESSAACAGFTGATLTACLKAQPAAQKVAAQRAANPNFRPVCARGLCYSAGLKRCVKCGSTGRPLVRRQMSGVGTGSGCTGVGANRRCKADYDPVVPRKPREPDIITRITNWLGNLLSGFKGIHGQPVIQAADLGSYEMLFREWAFNNFNKRGTWSVEQEMKALRMCGPCKQLQSGPCLKTKTTSCKQLAGACESCINRFAVL